MQDLPVTLKDHFGRFQASLPFSEQVTSKAWELLTKLYPKIEQKQEEIVWCICSLFAAEILLYDESKSNQQTVDINAMLKFSNITICQIIEPINVFLAIVGLSGSRIEPIVRSIERDYVLFRMFLEKYQKVLPDLIEIQNAPNYTKDPTYEFGWLLYLDGKYNLINQQDNFLKNLLYIFLSCLALLFFISPRKRIHVLQETFHKDPKIVETNLDVKLVQILQILCENNTANFYEVYNFFTTQFIQHIKKYCGERILLCEEIQGESNLEFLTSEKNIYLNIASLSQQYEKHHKLFHFDERDIEREGENLTGNIPNKTKQYYNYKTNSASSGSQPTRRSLSLELEAVSPKAQNKAMKPETPITSNMKIVNWLESLFETDSGNTPSGFDFDLLENHQNLQRYLKACTPDPSESIFNRLNQLLNNLAIHESKKLLIKKFYLRLLEAMLFEEEQRLLQADFRILLQHHLFHSSLIACCVEIVSYSYKIENIAFPKSLELFQIPAFELSKVVENVIRYEKSLPILLSDHLRLIEEKLLDSYVWEFNSPVFSLLQRGGTPQLQYICSQLNTLSKRAIINPAGASTPSTPVRSSPVISPISILSSPGPNPVKHTNSRMTISTTTKFDPPALESHNSPSPFLTGPPAAVQASQLLLSPRSQLYSPARTNNSTNKTHLSVSLEMLYKKVYLICYKRLQKLVTDLKSNNFEHILHALIYVIVWQNTLLMNRHLDQIIICTLYGVCRAQKLDITYRTILQHYRNQQQAESKIWREVFISNENGVTNTGDIIQFYNTVFISLLEPFLLDFQNFPTQVPIGTQSPALPNRSNINLTISPSAKLAQKEMPARVFNIGQSPSKQLSSFNDTIGKSTPSTKRKSARRLFTTEDDEQANKKQKLNTESTNNTTPIPQQQFGSVISQLSTNSSTNHPAILKTSK